MGEGNERDPGRPPGDPGARQKGRASRRRSSSGGVTVAVPDVIGGRGVTTRARRSADPGQNPP